MKIQRLLQVIYHSPLLSSPKAQGRGGASIVRCSSHREEFFEVDEKLQRLQVRSGFELFPLCHSHDVMGIRSCELSEPRNEIAMSDGFEKQNLAPTVPKTVHANDISLEICVLLVVKSLHSSRDCWTCSRLCVRML